ncbi:terminase large subunit [Clostridium sp.]|uniref:terminase large subunit n=1 Tax=Clostridium sp. TaxID=1506 RepID=UPI0039910818
MVKDLTTAYAKDVLEGKIVTGKLVKLACERHLNDLERAKTEEFPYYFDIEEADKTFKFFELLKFTDGEIAGQQVKLLSFQHFILGNLFGWKNKETGYRKYKKSLVMLARKNAKSLINSGIAIKTAGFDNYPNAQVYIGATKMQQAKVVWGQASKFIKVEPQLNELCRIREHISTIEFEYNGSKIVALGRDTNSIDGFDVHTGILDEVHSYKNNQMVKLLEDGAVNQANALISQITTAGFNLNGYCYKEWEYCKNVLNGLVENDNYFIYIAQMDEEDNIWDEKNWIKANPLVASLPKGMENLRIKAKEAREKGGEDLRNFLTKSLNCWYQYSDNGYLTPEMVKGAESDLDLEDFRGQECVVGLDLSSGGDLTSLALEFKYYDEITKEDKYFIHSHSFIPVNRVDEHMKTDKVPYDVWINDGLLTPTETLSGVKTDYKYIISYLKELIDNYELKLTAIAYDNFNANAFLADLEDFGVDTISITQSCKSLNDATVDFKLTMEAGNINFNRNNHLLKWSLANAITVSNSFGEIKIDKQAKSCRIDAVDSVIDAHKIIMQNDTYKKIDINESTMQFLDKMGW